jgi:iron complex outermembrane receptor protein
MIETAALRGSPTTGGPTIRVFAKRRSPLGLAIAAALSGAASLHGSPAIAANTGADSLGEVIVTARKREEKLQDVPLSVDVFSKKDIEHLAIAQFEDYATATPSMSFISAGPGTQLFVMRGVSDGSDPTFANSSATGFFVDDLSMSYNGVTPDLHLYDIERIEVLNGPQGTTYGASAMSGALRIITNKPDANAFSAGVDVDGGKIDGGRNNLTYEGFINLPLVDGRTALRVSAYSAYHGGFIDNKRVSRTWVNGTVSDNSPWAAANYNVQNVTGARIGLKHVITDGWQASLTYSYQRQLTVGAWDEDLARYGPRTVARFGPESKQYYAKMLDVRVDGDIGIADLVYASTYWSQPTRWVNEYSEYVQYVNAAQRFTPSALQGFACLTDPYWSPSVAGTTQPFTGCKVPLQWYDYRQHYERWSNEARLESKPGGRFHWLAGFYWEKTRNVYGDYFHMPGLQTASQGWQYYNNLYGVTTQPPQPDDWYSYETHLHYLQTSEFANVSFNLTDRLSVEAGAVHFHSDFSSSSYGGYWYTPQSGSTYGGSSNKWNGKFGVSYRAADNLLLYTNFAQGFRDGGVNGGLPSSCYQLGAPTQYEPDTLNSYEFGWKSTHAGGRLLWNGAAYYMPWKNLQTLLYDPDVCRSSSFNANIGDARVYGAESNVDFKVNASLSLQAAVSYTDARVTTNNFQNAAYRIDPGERLPFVPYFSFSANIRYETPVNDSLKGYGQFDVAHKGDMWSNLVANGTNGLPRVLQPPYSVMNLRLGLNPFDAHWLAEFYVSNLANKNAIIYTNTGNFDLRQTMNEPRVFGLRLNYRLGSVK